MFDYDPTVSKRHSPYYYDSVEKMAFPVPLHPLGKNGPQIPALGFGLMGLSYVTYGSFPSDEERFAILDRAVELGETFWDTAEYESLHHARRESR